MGVDYGSLIGYGCTLTTDNLVWRPFLDGLDDVLDDQDVANILDGCLEDAAEGLSRRFPYLHFTSAGDHGSGDTYGVVFIKSTYINTTLTNDHISRSEPVPAELAELDEIVAAGLTIGAIGWHAFDICV